MTPAPPTAKRQRKPKPAAEASVEPTPEILKRSGHGRYAVYAVSSVSDPHWTIHPVTIDTTTLAVTHCGQCDGWRFSQPHHCSHGDLVREAEALYQEERRQEARRIVRQATVELCAKCDRPASPRYDAAGLCTLHGYREERASS